MPLGGQLGDTAHVFKDELAKDVDADRERILGDVGTDADREMPLFGIDGCNDAAPPYC